MTSNSPANSRIGNDPNRNASRRRSNRLWIGLSVMLSAAILLWAFSLPFRRSATSIGAAAGDSKIQQEFLVTAEQRQSEADEFREQAIAMHHDYLRRLKKQKKLASMEKLPGRLEAKQTWENRAQVVRLQVDELDAAIVRSHASEDSMIWQDREHLTKTLSDAPQ